MGQINDKPQKNQKKPERAGNKGRAFPDATFIRYELDKSALEACKAWACDEVAAFSALHGLADSGYSVALRYDDYSEAYGCFCTQRRQDGENAGFVLAARGSTPFKALKQLLFKHFEVMGGRWEAFDTGRRNGEIDD